MFHDMLSRFERYIYILRAKQQLQVTDVIHATQKCSIDLSQKSRLNSLAYELS